MPAFIPWHHLPPPRGPQPFQRAQGPCSWAWGPRTLVPQPWPPGTRGRLHANAVAACRPPCPGALRLPKQTIPPEQSPRNGRCHSSLELLTSALPGGAGSGCSDLAHPLPTLPSSPLHPREGRGGRAPPRSRQGANWIATLRKHIPGDGTGGGRLQPALCWACVWSPPPCSLALTRPPRAPAPLGRPPPAGLGWAPIHQIITALPFRHDKAVHATGI